MTPTFSRPRNIQIDASFTPQKGLSLDGAASICGLKEFSWVQRHISKNNPNPLKARNLNGAFGSVSLNNKEYNDPPAGGGYAGQPVDNSFPYYCVKNEPVCLETPHHT